MKSLADLPNRIEYSVRFPSFFHLLLVAVPLVAAQTSTKPAVKAPVPAKAAPAAVAKAGAVPHTGAAATTTHGPTTAGPTTHGPTTSNPTTHGPTTAGPATHGPTTASPTTASPTRPPTTAPHPNVPGNPHGGAPVTKPAITRTGQILPAQNKVVRTPSGNEVRTRPDGKPADVHVAGRNMDIHHSLNGDRRVMVDRPDHSRIMADGRGHGYIQHPYEYRGEHFGHRTYYYEGRPYDRFYRPYYYNGVYVDVYAPAYYYRPAFYGWAYNPWAQPVPYAWGWNGNPWYGYYGSYFAPYPVYPTASAWLTDYLISTTLAAAYQAHQPGTAPPQPPADASQLTPEVKDLVAGEVQRQIALENSEAQAAPQNAAVDPASSGIKRMLTDNIQHIFVVGNSLDLVDAEGTECAVSEGDALQLAVGSSLAADATTTSLIMLSTKGGGECRRGVTVSVALADLQDMQNHMRETIDQGMGELQAKQSQGRLPALPPSAAGPPVKAAFAAGAPPPDTNAASEIKQETQVADAEEGHVLQQVAQNSGSGPASSRVAETTAAPATDAAPATVTTGQSIDEVVAILGPPKNKIDLKVKQLYVYKDMKITFINGKVTNVE